MLTDAHVASSGRKTVLVCDDEPHIVRLIEVNLQRLGFDVVTAFDGRQALAALEKHTPDLVLLDVMMPYVDGYEVLKAIRKNEETRSIPVIMLTVKAQEGDEARGMELGATRYLTKPFNPDDLRRFLEQWWT